MSTLKVNKLRDTAGSADAITLDPNGGAVLAGVTTVTSVKVGAAVTISESGIEATGVGITCANINGTQIGGRRNLIINGAMQVAQRGTSYTGTDNYHTVDRILTSNGGLDENCTMAQVDVSAGTTPYTLGFRKAFKITNGNQTSGAGSGDYVQIQTRLEAQDIANCGWNYTSTSSFVTLQFWVKSSVAQNFYGYIRCKDGTAQMYPFETGSLTADTWTKVVKTIPGNSNLTFDTNNEEGFQINISPFWGTDYTASSVTLNAWGAYSGSARTPDYTSTWYTTNDATLEITGLQLEVGPQATAFEHRSFGEELQLCHRYYYDYIYKETSGGNQYGTTNANRSLGIVQGWAATEVDHPVKFPTPMRAIPSLIQSTGSNYFQIEGGGATSTYVDGNWTLQFGTVNGCNIYATPDTNVTAGNCYHGVARNTSAQISFESEL